MKIKDEYLDIYISSPFTGKTIWARDLDPEAYKYFFNKGYEWMFYFTCEECGERFEDCECEDLRKKKTKK